MSVDGDPTMYCKQTIFAVPVMYDTISHYFAWLLASIFLQACVSAKNMTPKAQINLVQRTPNQPRLMTGVGHLWAELRKYPRGRHEHHPIQLAHPISVLNNLQQHMFEGH